MSSSLPSSLTELAGTLGGEPISPSTTGVIETPIAVNGIDPEKMSAQRSSGVYNPFDSDGKRRTASSLASQMFKCSMFFPDNASVDSFGKLEFGNHSSGTCTLYKYSLLHYQYGTLSTPLLRFIHGSIG